MKHLTNKFRILLATLILSTAFPGCSDYLDNPLKDRETGEDINLLILDFNFFNTRMTLKLLDAASGKPVETDATVTFSGKNGADIVTFAGEKKQNHFTAQSQLELALDPNIPVSEDNPFEFAVNVQAEGYNTLTKGFQLRTEGKKTLELKLSKIADEENVNLDGELDYENGDTTIVFTAMDIPLLKSASKDSFRITYSFNWDDVALFKDANGNLLFENVQEAKNAYAASENGSFFQMNISKYNQYQSEVEIINIDDETKSVLFKKLETGKVNSLTINGTEVADLNGGTIDSESFYESLPLPDIFGFAGFENDVWNILGTEVAYSNLDISYTLVKASVEPLCGTGSSITFTAGVTSSFSIDADVYDAEDNYLTTLTFKGNFPETFAPENTPQQAVKLVFRDNNPAFRPIPPLEIENFCVGSYEVPVEAAPDYEEYQVVLKAFCPENKGVAVSPTYSGEFKIKNSDNPWQGVDMAGGVVDLLALPGQEYELRLLWENSWEYTTIFTEFDANGNYLHSSSSDISSELLGDGRIRINIEHEFSQDVCDTMEW